MVQILTSNGNNVVITALGFDGQIETLFDGNYQLGVNDNTDTGIHVADQLIMMKLMINPEAIVLEFEGNLITQYLVLQD